MPISQEQYDAFEVRYYKWAGAEFRHEIVGDFPHFCTFPTGLGYRTMKWLKRRSEAERYSLATALVKRWLPRALEITGDHLAADELLMIERFIQFVKLEMPSERVARSRIRTDVTLRLKKKKLASTVRRELGCVLGQLEAEIGDGAWRYRMKFDKWDILSDIQCKATLNQLTYSHRIRLKDEYVCLKEFVSLLSYLGIAGQTDWTDLSDSDIPTVTECLRDLCNRFVESLPSLLDGL